MGRQARIKKERRAGRAAGMKDNPLKVVTGTIPFGPFDDDPYRDDFIPGLDDYVPGFDDPLGEEDDDCPICREMRAMGLSTDGAQVLTEEQAARLTGVMREHRDKAVRSYFADDPDEPD